MADLAEIFQEYKDIPVALYGLGTETERVLKVLDKEYHIIGLLDSFRSEGIFYGKPVISLEGCIKSQVKLIIVVARPGSCKAIASKIGRFCMENGIALIDVRGKDLCVQNKVAYGFKGMDGITKGYLLKRAAESQVISVDLFDTLVMRRTLFPSDVIELVGCRLREKGVYQEGFFEKRLQREKELSRYSAPTLEEIYEQCGLSGITAGELAQLEWDIDYSLIIPRQEVVDILADLYHQGKKVYIITDTYYSREQLIKVLEKCRITEYTDILASCEYRTGKTQRLFEELKMIAGAQKYLHIGDDLVADIESAERLGISACQIYSGHDLLEMTGYLGLDGKTDTLSSRLKIGAFAARLFNSPFQFETEDRVLSIKNAYDIGYLFMAPMITDFVVWLGGQIRKNNLQNIWFSARDGYLIKQLYYLLNGSDSSVYFLTSRMAAIRAGMEDEKDIDYVAGMKFSGTLQQQLEKRFGIKVDDKELEGRSLSDFTEMILEQAENSRRNYRIYIESLSLKEGNIAFFDFVAKGTTQMYVGRLVDRHLKGFYFLRLEREYMKDRNLDIVTFYEDPGIETGTGGTQTSPIYEDYYILETILTSGEPSVAGFDEKGHVIYASETRSEQDIKCFQRMQEGIIDYFKSYIRVCPESERHIDQHLDERFLELVHKVKILDRDFKSLKVEDPFFNRMTDMQDLL